MRHPPENSASGRSWSSRENPSPESTLRASGSSACSAARSSWCCRSPGAGEQGVEARIVGGDAAQLVVQRIQFLAQIELVAERFHGAVEHRTVEALGGLLRQVADARAAGHHLAAVVGLQRPDQDFEQGGLAGAVRPDQRMPVAGRDHPIDLIEQDARADRVANLVELNHGLGVGAGRRRPPIMRRAARGSGLRAPEPRTGLPCGCARRRTRSRRRRTPVAGSAPGPSGCWTDCHCPRCRRPGPG